MLLVVAAILSLVLCIAAWAVQTGETDPST
jgi:hypothetical protein